VPKLFLDMKSVKPQLKIADPDIVNELYVSKNKFTEKEGSVK
jgi:hypothetical protein